MKVESSLSENVFWTLEKYFRISSFQVWLQTIEERTNSTSSVSPCYLQSNNSCSPIGHLVSRDYVQPISKPQFWVVGTSETLIRLAPGTSLAFDLFFEEFASRMERRCSRHRRALVKGDDFYPSAVLWLLQIEVIVHRHCSYVNLWPLFVPM